MQKLTISGGDEHGILIRDYETARNAEFFIRWHDGLVTRGRSRRWLMADEQSAKSKADDVFQNAHYCMTWDMYRNNDFDSDPIDMVLKNKRSVFHHLINLSNAPPKEKRERISDGDVLD